MSPLALAMAISAIAGLGVALVIAGLVPAKPDTGRGRRPDAPADDAAEPGRRCRVDRLDPDRGHRSVGEAPDRPVHRPQGTARGPRATADPGRGALRQEGDRGRSRSRRLHTATDGPGLRSRHPLRHRPGLRRLRVVRARPDGPRPRQGKS
uniref:Uncharacterized protein n=1 Tax=Janibacter limosus TaxID=53458 RepID=A0AC61U1S5_9MICO|nr:hypothetical protein [Janibacter limosus]